MKKILTLISTIGLTSVGVNSLVACEKNDLPSITSAGSPGSHHQILEYKSNTNLTINWKDVARVAWSTVVSQLLDNPAENSLVIDGNTYYVHEGLLILIFYADNVPPLEEIIAKQNSLDDLSKAIINMDSKESEDAWTKFDTDYEAWVSSYNAMTPASSNDDFNWSVVNDKDLTFVFGVYPEAVYKKSEGYKQNANQPLTREQPAEIWDLLVNCPIVKAENIYLTMTNY